MYIAEQKKRDNIAEYLLYMWQLEDVLRAYQLDIEKIQKALIDPSDLSDENKNEARQWYMQLIEQMQTENIQQQGHLSSNIALLNKLNLLHSQLLKNTDETEYKAVYSTTLPYIQELREKSQSKELPDIEVCFTALYGYLLLKLQKKEISVDTTAAMSQISKLLRSLSEKYHLQENKEV